MRIAEGRGAQVVAFDMMFWEMGEGDGAAAASDWRAVGEIPGGSG